MTSDGDPGDTQNVISGGIQFGPVLQGRDIQATFQLPAAPPVALAQLPGIPSGFTGRDDELTVLSELLDPAAPAGPVVVSAVAGLAGVGKTTLAVAAGHAARQHGWYRGGVLFIDLHGYDDASVQPAQALDALLRALGIAAEHIPPGAEERAGLYRSVLAQVREPVLVIADNVSSEAQVRPLLPGTARHKVIVTSRHTLAELDARLVDVTVLNEEAAVNLLDVAVRTARPEDDRITSYQGAARRLAERCGGLPLALQIAAALLKADPTLKPVDLADELSSESVRLERLQYDNGSELAASSVAAAFELSCRKLKDDQARVFRLLAVNRGPDVSTDAAAALADLAVNKVRSVLADLARAHLIEATPGVDGRWHMHDLLRLYTSQLSDANAEADGKEQARDRLLTYYLNTAEAAGHHLRAMPGVVKPAPKNFTGRDSALAWLDAERSSLVAAVSMAAQTNRDEAAMRLPSALAEYLTQRRHFDDLMATSNISLSVAQQVGNRYCEGRSLVSLGVAMIQTRHFNEAITSCREAAAIFRETGDRHFEGRALTNLGVVLIQTRRFEEAITSCREAAAIFRETGDLYYEGKPLTNLGTALQKMQQLKEAIAALQGAATIYRQIGDQHGEGLALVNLGLVLQKLDRFEEAITAHQDAAAIFSATEDKDNEDLALNNLGFALTKLGLMLQKMGRFEEAITTHQEAVMIFRETGYREGEDLALESIEAAVQHGRPKT